MLEKVLDSYEIDSYSRMVVEWLDQGGNEAILAPVSSEVEAEVYKKIIS